MHHLKLNNTKVILIKNEGVGKYILTNQLIKQMEGNITKLNKIAFIPFSTEL